jgi:hypothetical protein
MKTNIFLLALIILGATSTCTAQERTCNRVTYIESYQERLPKDICLPEDYILRAILSDTTDMNGDGKVDFAAKLRKMNKQDGDTTLVVLYKQDQHGHFEEWATFGNLFPVYLKNYHF